MRKILISGGPQTRGSELSPEVVMFWQSLLEGFATNPETTVLHGHPPKVTDIIKQKCDPSCVEAHGLAQFLAGTPNVTLHDDLSGMRETMAEGADIAVMCGGRTFSDMPEGTTPGLYSELEQCLRANTRQIVVVSSFGGNSAEERFLALASQDSRVTIVDFTDPKLAAAHTLQLVT